MLVKRLIKGCTKAIKYTVSVLSTQTLTCVTIIKVSTYGINAENSYKFDLKIISHILHMLATGEIHIYINIDTCEDVNTSGHDNICPLHKYITGTSLDTSQMTSLVAQYFT